MDYKVCRNCNERSDYNDKFCVKCGFDITKPANYDIVSTNGSNTIYRIWSVSMSKFLATILTLVLLGSMGLFTYTYYGEALKETALGSKILSLIGTDEDSVETSAVSNQASASPTQNTNTENKNKNTETKSKKSKKGYVLPKSNKKVYSEKALRKLSSRKLAVARNEIYARHGYIFNDSSWKKYFKKKKWYHEKYDSEYFNSHSGEILNKYEKKNLKRIQKIERER